MRSAKATAPGMLARTVTSVRRVRFPTVLRCGLGAAGLAAMAFGADLLVTGRYIRGWMDVLVWMAGIVVVHDGVLAPSVIVLGAAVGARWRRRLRWPFVVAGSLTIVALPLLLREGPAANPSVVPLDYPRGLAISVGVVLAVALCWAAGRWAWGRFGPARPGGSGEQAGQE